MVNMDKTKIQVNRDTWGELNSLKRLGESFDDVLKRLIEHWKETTI